MTWWNVGSEEWPSAKAIVHCAPVEQVVTPSVSTLLYTALHSWLLSISISMWAQCFMIANNRSFNRNSIEVAKAMAVVSATTFMMLVGQLLGCYKEAVLLCSVNSLDPSTPVASLSFYWLAFTWKLIINWRHIFDFVLLQCVLISFLFKNC